MTTDPSPDADLLAIMREIANHTPIETYWIDGDDMTRCIYCQPNYATWRGQPDYPVTIDGEDHAPDCVWLRARQIVARLDGAPDV